MTAHTGRAPRRRWLGRIGLLFAALLCAGYAGELVVRCFYVVPIPIARRYALGPRQLGATIRLRQLEYDVELRYNLNGFRDVCRAFRAEPGSLRILFLGDSFVEGMGVAESERFSDLLIARARQLRGQDWEGRNAGQIATGPSEYFNNLVDFGVALRPRIVILGLFVGNDFYQQRTQGVPANYEVRERLPASESRRTTSSRSFLTLEYLRRLVQRAAGNPSRIVRPVHVADYWSFYFDRPINREYYLRSTGASEAEFDRFCARMAPGLAGAFLNGLLNPSMLHFAIVDSRPLATPAPAAEAFYNEADFHNTTQLVSECASILRTRGIPMVVVVLPDIFQVHPDMVTRYLLGELGMPRLPARLAELEGLRRRLDQYLENEKIPFVDCTESLRQSGRPVYFFRDQHLNAAGHMIVAEALWDLLRRHGMLEAG